MEQCKTCGKETEGYKCDACGAEAAEHDAKHACGPDRCMPKCRDCSEAEAKYSC